MSNGHNREWYCIGTSPMIYAFGYLAGDEVHEITAKLERLPDGRWRWSVLSDWSRQGIEPNREFAEKAAIRSLQPGE